MHYLTSRTNCLILVLFMSISYVGFFIYLFWMFDVNSHLFMFYSANAGSNKAASSSTSLNTRKLDDETENLAREYLWFVYCSFEFILFF